MTEITKPTFQEYIVAVNAEYVAQRPHARRGQVYFNVLYDMRPFLANRVRANADLDPFYRDKNINAFLEFVAANW